MAQPEPTPQEADTEYHRTVLNGLIAMANDIARHLHAEIIAPAKAPGPEDEPRQEPATVAFDRMARTVRRTILLARTLHQPARDTTQRTLARKRILRTVEDTITRKAGPETADRLHAELGERIDQPDLEDEIGARPTEDIIQDILRDLGIGNIPGTPNPWPRRTPTDLEALHQRARTRRPPTSLSPGERGGVRARCAAEPVRPDARHPPPPGRSHPGSR